MKKILTFIVLSVTVACTPEEQVYFGKRIPVNGTELFVKVMGKGEPLFVLHGGPGLSHDYFLPHLEPLAETAQLVLFDQRGMGRSSVELDSTTFSMELLVEDIEILRRELGFDRIHLMAHSWGGVLALRYAIDYPGRLKTLILCNSVPASSEFAPAAFANFAKLNERQNMADLQPLMEKIEKGSRDIAVYNRFMQLNFRPVFFDTADVNKLQLNLSENYLKTRELLQYLPPPTEPVNLLPELKNVSVPTLIIRSEMEPMPLDGDRKLQETLSGARLASIDKAGHFPFIEQQQQFLELVTGFVRNPSGF